MAGNEGIKWVVEARVDKYTDAQTAFVSAKTGILSPVGDDLRKFCREPEDGVAYAHGNLLTTVGLTAITALLVGTGGSGALYNLKAGSPSTNAVMGVGSTSTAAAITDVALGADNTSGAWYQVMDNTYPTVSAGVITGQCSVATGNANYAWNEWCFASGTGAVTNGIAIGSVFATNASKAMWNHKIQSLGTKSSGTWVLVATVTLA
jgi:hypothetical protein